MDGRESDDLESGAGGESIAVEVTAVRPGVASNGRSFVRGESPRWKDLGELTAVSVSVAWRRQLRMLSIMRPASKKVRDLPISLEEPPLEEITPW